MLLKRHADKGRLTRAQHRAYISIILCSIVLMYLGFGRGIRFFLVPSVSMEPTLRTSDYIVTLKDRQYRRGDIVVLTDPKDNDAYLVKRIVGVAGDTVEIDPGGALLINGKYASEPYIKEPMEFRFPSMKVEAGHVFVMGDNRNDSEDSVTWEETVPVARLIGRVRFIYSPVGRMGPVRSYPLTNLAGE
jgi:signal peptidase I